MVGREFAESHPEVLERFFGALVECLDALVREPARMSALVAKSMSAAVQRVTAAVFEQSADPFPGVNAATLTLRVGDAVEAAAIATRVLAKLPAPSDYWGWASAAEASAVCGDMARATPALANVATMAVAVKSCISGEG